MNLKTFYDRTSASLARIYTNAKGYAALTLELAVDRYRERVRAIASKSYYHYLAIVTFVLLPVFCMWVLPVGLFIHMRNFVREVIDDFRSIDLEDFTRAAWERNVGK